MENEWLAKRLLDEDLVGATITDIGCDEEGFACLSVSKDEWKNGKLLWIQSDPEGDAPGYVEVQEK